VDVKFHPRDEELFTVGRNGLFRWPLHTQPELLHIGPARRLNVPGRMERLSVDREGRVVCGVEGGTNGGGRVLNLEDPTDRVIFVPHENAASVATSPNGKWVATGTQNGFGVKIWDTQSGELLRILIDNERTTQVVASPDSRWLVTGTSAAFDIWEAGSWELVRRIGRESSGEAVGNAAFSPDGSVLAIAYSGSVVQLIDVATGGPLARLQPPNPDIITWMAFSPDGSQLAISTATNVIRLWDLRLIRSQLTTIGLNWDLPPYPPPSDEPSRVQLHVELGDFPHFAPGHQNLINAMHHWRNSQWGQAIAEVSKGLELLDFAYQAEALNNLAWYLVACPDPQYRNVARALQLAQSATELAPHVASYWNTLGVAHYYSKEWTEAIAALEQSDQLEPGRFGQNGFFLAMSHWRLGTAEVKNAIEEQTVNHQAIHREKARLCFDQAVRWVETNKPKNKREFDELNLFRAEAAKLLGLHEQKD
jgi:hypothetical protein